LKDRIVELGVKATLLTIPLFTEIVQLETVSEMSAGKMRENEQLLLKG
jgi:hypothetical protein